MTDLLEKGTGSSLTANEWNILKDKLTDGTDSIYAGSVTISGTAVKVLSPIGTGSPTTWGMWGQAGSATLSAGSSVWVVYGTPFLSVPIINVSAGSATNNFWVINGSTVVGSTCVLGNNASTTFSWMGFG